MKNNLRILFWITILNYIAQIPYYLHNYYFPYHALPSLMGMVLLGITLVWFLLGYRGVQKRNQSGYYILLSFLIVEALFYLHAIVFGAFIFQIQNPSLIIKTVFLIGYVSGLVAAYNAYLLIRHKRAYIY